MNVKIKLLAFYSRFYSYFINFSDYYAIFSFIHVHYILLICCKTFYVYKT